MFITRGNFVAGFL